MKKIKLTQGKFAIVDDEDFRFLSRFKWKLITHKNGKNGGVITSFWSSQQHPTSIPMWGFLVRRPNGFERVVHLNKNGLDYRKKNLCVEKWGTFQHTLGKRKGTSSKFRGVSWNKEKMKWDTYISIKNKTHHLGKFRSEVSAAKAYNKKAIELYGHLAYQNKI